MLIWISILKCIKKNRVVFSQMLLKATLNGHKPTTKRTAFMFQGSRPRPHRRGSAGHMLCNPIQSSLAMWQHPAQSRSGLGLLSVSAMITSQSTHSKANDVKLNTDQEQPASRGTSGEQYGATDTQKHMSGLHMLEHLMRIIRDYLSFTIWSLDPNHFNWKK